MIEYLKQLQNQQRQLKRQEEDKRYDQENSTQGQSVKKKLPGLNPRMGGMQQWKNRIAIPQHLLLHREQQQQQESMNLTKRTTPLHMSLPPWETSNEGSFFLLLIGPPNSGKSTMIQKLLQGVLYEKYHYVFVFSPNDILKNGRLEKGKNWFHKPEIRLVKEIFDWCSGNHPEADEETPIRVLMIFDDTVHMMREREWYEIVSQRRHLKEDRIKLGVIMTSHKYRGLVLPSIRMLCDSIVLLQPASNLQEVLDTLYATNEPETLLSQCSTNFMHILPQILMITDGWDRGIARITLKKRR